MASLRCTVLLLGLSLATAAAPEPWPPLSGGAFTGPAVPLSPDPLVSYIYSSAVNLSSLQVFPVLPATTVLAPGTLDASFVGWQTLSSAAPLVTASGPGGLILDFGVELPAWLELDSPDLAAADLPLLTLGTGEYSEVDIIGRTLKQGTPKAYGTTYRLETNSELYEGVRYGFLTLSAAPSRPFTITGLRAVAQAKPVNYTGAFSGGARLTRIWYTAAYTVRTNLMPNYMGAILEDRGDRYSWAGDSRVAQITSLLAFGNTWDVLQNLKVTGKSQNGIASYSLYFTDSVMDYYSFTKDASVLQEYSAEVARVLLGAAAAAAAGRTTPQTFYGWDDRLGSGFKNASCSESQWAYKLVLVRLLARWGETLGAAGNATSAAAFASLADATWAAVQAALSAAAAASGPGAPWFTPLGMHAAAEALSTQRCSAAEAAAILAARFNDTTSLCSLSNFNQFWVLRGLAAAGALDRGLAAIELCWGGELDMGGTTFWEISSPDWASFTAPGEAVPNGENGYTSLCHPWSSAPTSWLSQQALGVRPLTGPAPPSAWGSVLIAPHLPVSALAEAAAPSGALMSGRVPVGEGGEQWVGVEVEHTRLRITLPRGVNATLVLSEALLLRLQGSSAELPPSLSLSSSTSSASAIPLRWVPAGHETLPAGYIPPLLELGGGVIAAGAAARAAALPLLTGGGVYTLQLPPPPPAAPHSPPRALPLPPFLSPFPPAVYGAPFLGADWQTRGSWMGVYGGAGGVLFGLGGSAGSSDLSFLPPYVSSVTAVFGYQRGTWDTALNVSDARALQLPGGGAGRSLGYLCDPAGSGSPTFAIDVTLAATAPPFFTVAVYAADWDSRGRRGTVALLDGRTLNPLSPIQGLRDYEEGVWLAWNVSSSISSSGFRVRVSQTRGDNAPVSALLFG